MPSPGELVPPTLTATPERAFQIFAAGTYRGKTYSREFLQAACDNFQKYQTASDPVGMPKPPAVLLSEDDVKAAGVAIGHEDSRINVLEKAGADMLAAIAKALLQKTDLPASGWVREMFMNGDAVFVRLEGVPVKLAADCNAGLFRYCSAEWYDDYEGPSGTKYGPMLRRVAILGGDLPALKFLGRIPPFVFSERPEFPGVRVTCFSESLAMSHDELILALSKFVPNVAALVAAGVNDETLAILLKGYQEAAPETESTLPGVTLAEGETKPTETPGGMAVCSEDQMKGSPAVFSELKALIPNLRTLSAELSRQSAQMAQQTAASKVHLEALARKAKETERNEVTIFCERLVRERKIPPYDLATVDGQGKRKPSRMEILLGLDNQNKVFAFGEEQLTPREVAMRELDSRTPQTFSEKLPAVAVSDEQAKEARRVQLLAASDVGQGVLMKEAKAKGQVRTADGRIVR